MKKKIPLLISALLMLTFAISGCENIVLVPGRSSGAITESSEASEPLSAYPVTLNGTEILKAPETEKVKSGARLLIRKLAEASAIRAPQADTIAHEIAASPHPYIIVCGDFNDTPISYAHRTIAQDLDDAFTQSGRGLGISYNQNRFYFRIDNILTSKNLRAYNCTVDRSIKESDHYPIWCYITKRY